MKILVTGGAGFIGSHLVDKLLKDNHLVCVIDNLNDYYDPLIKLHNLKSAKNNKNFIFYQVDIENINNLKDVFNKHNFDVVVHLAARAGVSPSLINPTDYMNTNVLGTVNILECMREYSVSKIVVASSSSVYGNCSANIFSENLKVSEPISPYAASKIACEQICYTWHYLYNINTVALRFFTVYGPRQRPDLAISKFTSLIDKGLPIEMYGDGTSVRDYTYIDDIISGVISSIEYSKSSYEVINLGGGAPISLIEMIKSIEEELNKKAVIIRREMQQGDVKKTACDTSKARILLNYVPQFCFKDGLHRFIEWKRKTDLELNLV